MQSKAKTVEAYLGELPAEKRQVIEKVRSVILQNLPGGFKEGMQYGMIGYFVPLETYPDGYLGKQEPLPYIGLAAQKDHYAIYFMYLYADERALNWFKKAFESAGKKLDMGKSCVKFKKLEDLPLDVIGKAVDVVSVEEFIEHYENTR